jgi:hypothetical protein
MSDSGITANATKGVYAPVANHSRNTIRKVRFCERYFFKRIENDQAKIGSGSV